MKNCLTLVVGLLLAQWLSAQVMYDDFENQRRVHYEFVHGGFGQTANNPQAAGLNTSPKVGEYVRNPGEQWDVLVILPPALMNDVSDYVSGTKTMSLKLYSPAAGLPVQITLEDSSTAEPFNYPTGRHSVYLGTTTVANQWETITLAYDHRPDGTVPNTTVTSMILLFNPGTFTNDTYYFDDLMGPEYADPCGAPMPATQFEDFDCDRNLIYEYTDGWLNKYYNAFPGGINTSTFAGEYTRNPDGNGTDVIVAEFAQPLDLTTDNQLKMSVYGDTGFVVISLQDDTTEILAVTEEITMSNTWEELTFDFSPITNYTGIDHVVILFKPGSTNNDVYWWDDFRLDGFVQVSREDALPDWLRFTGMYPNPADDLARIDFELDKAATVDFVLTDLQGRTIESAQQSRSFPAGAHDIGVNTAELPAGMYLWTLAVDGLPISGKMQITH